MSTRQRKDGGVYYYEFMAGGKRYNGVCEGCTTKRDADRYEREMRRIAANTAKIESVDELYKARQKEITGHNGIPLVDAFTKAMNKPRKREMSPKQYSSKQSVFSDFVAFMRDRYPDVTDAAAVTRSQAEEYISHIRKNGRYLIRNSYTRGGKTIERATRKISVVDDSGATTAADASTIPSGRTFKLFLTTCTEVFSLIAEDAGISKNPFSGIPAIKTQSEAREAFSDDELKLIHDNLDGFTRPLFITAIFTGLREGDICTLRRDCVDFQNDIIRLTMRKTGVEVELPIADHLRLLLLEYSNNDKGEYVFPDHAAMYLKNAAGVSYRVKRSLENLGIHTTRIPAGRTRAVSVKDLHSCRHTFCYYAGVAGVPLATVQAIVGHMTPEMTKRYMAHTTIADKRAGMAILADRLALTFNSSGSNDGDAEREELSRIARCADIELVKKLLEVYRENTF